MVKITVGDNVKFIHNWDNSIVIGQVKKIVNSYHNHLKGKFTGKIYVSNCSYNGNNSSMYREMCFDIDDISNLEVI